MTGHAPPSLTKPRTFRARQRPPRQKSAARADNDTQVERDEPSYGDDRNQGRGI